MDSKHIRKKRNITICSLRNSSQEIEKVVFKTIKVNYNFEVNG